MPESKMLGEEELLRVYGPAIQTWGDVKSWDDLVIPQVKSLVSQLEDVFKGTEKCHHLIKRDDYFCYCMAQAKEHERMGKRFTARPTVRSAQYLAQVDHFSLQLWCMPGEDRNCECMYFKEAEVDGNKNGKWGKFKGVDGNR